MGLRGREKHFDLRGLALLTDDLTPQVARHELYHFLARSLERCWSSPDAIDQLNEVEAGIGPDRLANLPWLEVEGNLKERVPLWLIGSKESEIAARSRCGGVFRTALHCNCEIEPIQYFPTNFLHPQQSGGLHLRAVARRDCQEKMGGAQPGSFEKITIGVKGLSKPRFSQALTEVFVPLQGGHYAGLNL
jgi:hypothetical protein